MPLLDERVVKPEKTGASSIKPPVAPITLAIVAMGGEGGGVLADWIVDTAEHAGFYAQTTSVPGVAQRTGATMGGCASMASDRRA